MPEMHSVLIVDDEPVNLLMLKTTLAKSVRVQTATTGEDAIALAEATLPDLIFLDIRMPGLTGYDVCRQLRKNPAMEHTRIILVSSMTEIDDRLEGYRCGADDYITKPFVPEELLAKTRVFLKLAQTERSLKALNAELEEKVRLRSRQLVQVERAAFIGAHAAEIVHNLNNPLMIVLGNLNRLDKMYPDNDRIKRASSGAARMQGIIASILQARKAEKDQSHDVDLNALIKDELKLLEVESFFKHQITTELALGDLPAIRGQAGHFAQSLGNLIKNAVDAMHDRETRRLRIETRMVDGSVEIVLADTGVGIAPADLARIFDPFYTTKPLEGKAGEPVGTGLGLASVKRMLASYGATVDFESAVGVGTTVRVTLPVERGVAVAHADAATAAHYSAALPLNERARLESLVSYNILDSGREQLFDELTLLASKVCDTPVSFITLIDEKRQYFKAATGFDATADMPREISFCSEAVRGVAPLVVEDMTQDRRFAANPLVAGGPKVRFYAGVPLVSSDGHALGTICVLDMMPRSLTPQQLTCLQAISRQVMSHLEERKFRARNPQAIA